MINEHYTKVYLYRRIVQAKLHLDENYADNIDIEKIATEAYFSKSQFIRLFNAIYGKTPGQHLRYVRIERAKELLMKGTPVSQTCKSVGFECVFSFSELFFKATSMSPSEFLAHQQKARERIVKSRMEQESIC